MPTYRNDSTSKSFSLVDVNGNVVTVIPGMSVQTYERVVDDDITLTSELPIYNPCLASYSPTSGELKTLNEDTDYLKVTNLSDQNITVFLQAASNSPGILVGTKEVGRIPESGSMNNKISKIVASFPSGTTGITIEEFKI
jgi:hypothetical protein